MFGMNSVEWKLAELVRGLVSLGHGRGTRGSPKGGRQRMLVAGW